MATSVKPVSIVGTSGKDYLTGVMGGSILDGGAGDDTYYVLSTDDFVLEAAGGGFDHVMTWRTSYTLSANVEKLSILGNDLFGIGNDSDNTLVGGDGRQTLYGAGGNDVLTGGKGSDIFVVKPGSGSDIITDFQSDDMVQLGSYGFRNFSELLGNFEQAGRDAILKLNNGETLTFKDKSVSDFSTDDFQYALDRDQLTKTFSDEFDTLRLQKDGGTWRTSFFNGDAGRNHDVNHEKQFYIDADWRGLGVNPFSVKDGILTIEGKKADAETKAATGYDYTSGLLSSRDNFSQKYGYFEIKCEVPAQTGTWPAFWLLPANGVSPPELDVFEQIGTEDSRAYLTAHSSSTGTHTTKGVSSWVDQTTGGMHTYGLLWTKEELVWYIDGVEAFRTATPADLHQPMYMVTNLAIGGDWPGDPNSDFQSAKYKIDYIRAYQLNSELDNKNIVTSDKWSITLDKVADGLVLKGSLNLNGTGNDRANTLVGNDGANILDGGANEDTMSGGAGNDTYIVDNVGDVVIEAVNAGMDTVKSSISLVLSANVENLTLTGAAAINASGNALNNVIIGNSAKNVLNGGEGADTLSGGAGDDTYYVDNSGDAVVEWSNGGNDIVYASVSHSLASNVEELTLTGSANIDATGNWMNNTILGNTGNNSIDGGSGADRMVGGEGNDLYYVDNAGDRVVEADGEGIDTVSTSVSYTLAANVENLIYTGQWSAVLTGNALNNTITGNNADNTLDGGAGIDRLIGGSGNDTYIIDNPGDVVVEAANGGIDTIKTTSSYTLGANLENLVYIGQNSAVLTGNALNNAITGNGAGNILDGGAGADTLTGGAGDDTYYVDNAGDTIVEWSNGGNDIVYASVSHTLASQVETLVLTGSTNINATGNWMNNTILGNAGNNVIDGGAGADRMVGGNGNDTYYVDNTGDRVVEADGEGIDTVSASISYTLGDNVENLVYTGQWSAVLTGNALNNTITGNNADNTLDGGAGIDRLIGGLGNDTYIVDNAGDVVVEAANGGVDTVRATSSYTLGANLENLIYIGPNSAVLTGNALNNAITGNGAGNVLDGGAGADTLTGGAGDDTYYVDNVGDTIVEWSNGGNDTVYASISYVLASQVEALTLTGSANIDATGNWMNNTILGNAGNNVIDGGSGADRMVGGDGNDTYYVDNTGDRVVEADGEGIDTVYTSVSYALGDNVENLVYTGQWSAVLTGNALNNTITGNNADNTLDGGAGIDRLIGGLGNDTYIVDNAGDVVVEAANGGVDTVRATSSYTLGANLENLIYIGPNSAVLTGNALNNAITGNGAGNVLDGGAGADTLTGGAGDDTYYVDNVGDTIVEWSNGGNDTVYASISYVLASQVEALTLTGSANIDATGNWMNNTILGNAGNNVIDGGSGADRLEGGAGADVLTGGSGQDSFVFKSLTDSTADAFDTITDLAREDRIDLSDLFSGALSYRGIGEFTGHAGEVKLQAVSTGGTMIKIDLNGDGVSDSQIFVSNLSASSFMTDGSNFIL